MQDLNSNHLGAIKGKRFTRRETDVIACLMCGRAATIPSLLSISSRTVEAHVRNIMLKLECNSREGIVNFVEQSGKISFTKAHYQNLAMDVLFEKCLKEIANLTRKQAGLCAIWFEPNQSASHMNIIHRLIKHIKVAGIDTILKKKVGHGFSHFHSTVVQTQNEVNQYALTVLDKNEYDLQRLTTEFDLRGQENHVSEDSAFVRLDYLFNDDSLHDSKACKSNVYDFSAYYLGVFKILQTIYPKQDFEKQISEFNMQYESILRGEIRHVNDFESHKQSKGVNLKNKSLTIKNHTMRFKLHELLLHKSVHIIFFAMTFFAMLFLFAAYKGNDAESGQYSKKYIRSDLRIPAESVLLGRPTLIRKMKDHFSNHSIKKPIISVIGLTGIAGSGKTTLARAYAKTLSSASVVWEINAETHDSIVESFKNLAHALAQTKESKNELSHIQSTQNVDEMVKRTVMFVAKHLNHSPNWLLIYDNVESFSDLEHFFPHDVDRYGAGKVIITTRDQSGISSEYLNADSVIDVEALNTSETLTLFTKMTYNTEAYVFSREKEKKLIRFLSNIPPYPFDVSAASYYIKNSDITCEMYLERMKENTKAFEDAQAAFLKDSSVHAKTRYNIITLSIKRLIDAEPEFKNLLMLLGFVAAENIPRALLESYKDPVLIDRFISSLKKYAFITGKVLSKDDGDSTFSIHRSTQKIIRDFLCESNANGEVEKTMQEFANLIQRFSETYVLKKPGTTLNLVSHINEFMQNSDKMLKDAAKKEQIKQDLYYALGYAHKRFSRSLLREKEYFVKAYARQAQTQHIPNHKLAVMLNELASICVDLSHNDDAILYAQKSLDLCKTLPDKTLVSAHCLRVIGLAYLFENDFVNAKLHFNKGIHVLSSLGVNERREAEASIYALLGRLYSVKYINGEHAEDAIGYGHKAVTVMNAEHQLYTKIPPKSGQEKISCEVARAKASLGDVYCHFGDYKKAYELGYRDAQYIIDNHLDTCSHYLLKVYMAIGMGEIHLRERRLMEAKKTLTKAIKDAEDLVVSDNMLLLSLRVFSAETHIRLNELDNACNDCLAAFKTEQKECPNYSKLILATAYYHAALIKYTQGDFSKSFEYFLTFFEHVKIVCKAILSKKMYKELDVKGAFNVHKVDLNIVNSDVVKPCFKQATTVFKAIYGDSHAFVKEYVENFD